MTAPLNSPTTSEHSDDTTMSDITRIRDVFVDRSIFITGGTGFIGKVLIEKLLRSCPGINKLYILLRPRRGKTITERLEEISKLPLFEKLHTEKPGDFQAKVIPINGDVTLPCLGISPEDRKLLIENVSLVYHVAATVKFDQALSDAILMNVRGTKEVCSLVLEMHRCDLMVHVSTAYAHTSYNPIEEQMYPPTADWKQCINAAEKLDAYDMSKLQSLIMGPFPNTYTYTKGLAEWVVYDMLNGKVSNLIIRPSIIIATWRDPFPGWIDNFNGPAGLFAANGTGLIRINLVKERIADFLPVDMAVRSFVNITWYRLSQAHDYEEKTTSVHNCSSNTYQTLTTLQVADIANSLADEVAISTCVWYPSSRRTEDITVFKTVFVMLHILPALFFDLVLRLLSYEPIVMKVQRRIYVAIIAMQYFILNSWTIANDSLYNLEVKLPTADLNDFGYDAKSVDNLEYFRNALFGGMKYLLKEDMSKLKQNRQRIKFLKYLDIIFTILFFAYVSYLLLVKWTVPQFTFNYVGSYFNSLHTPLSFLPPSYQ